MSDDSIVKIMQSLGLDYSPAITATEMFQKSITNLNKDLAQLKASAMQSAKDINNAFLSQLGQINNKQIVDQWSRPIQSMQKEVSKSAVAMSEMKTAHESVAVAAEKHRTPIKELIGQYNLLGTKVDDSTQSFTANAAQLYAISKAAKEVIGTIKDVEIGMVEIQRVMDDSSFVFGEYRDNLLGLGVEYGQTFDTVQNIALRWAQSGYNVADSLKLAETSLLALNAGELDAKYATEAMIGIMAQWELQADDLVTVMDKVNKTADSYSTTAQDLVDGLLRSSGAAKVMNLSLEDTISLLTVMREASGRTGKEVGNALNSILSYIQRPKSIDVMEAMGIKVFADEAKTQFRNALEIFQDIAVNWDKTSKDIQDGFVAAADDAQLFNEDLAVALGLQEEWNDLQKRDISQAAAGVHRRNFFIGMIERMTEVQGVLNNMMDAEGYIMEKNALAMDTLEKKQMSLKASVEALAVAMGDAGLGSSLKLLTDGSTKAINAFNEMPKGVRDTILVMTELTLTVKALEAGMNLFGLKMPIASAGINILTGGIGNLTTNTMAFATALKTGLIANLPLLGSAAVIGGIIALRNHMKRAREEAQLFITTTQDNIKSLEEQKQGLTELANEYETLKDKEKNLTATAEEKERLKEIQRELVELYDVSISGIDAEGNAYADSTEAIKDRIKTLEELQAIEHKRLETALIKKRDSDIKAIEDNIKERERLEQKLIEADQKIKEIEEGYLRRENLRLGGFQITPSHKEYDEMVKEYIERLKGHKLDIEIAIDDINNTIKAVTSDTSHYLKEYAQTIISELYEGGQTASDSARLFANQLAEGLSATSKGILELKDNFENAIKGFIKLDRQYEQAVSKGDTTAINNASKAIMEFVGAIADGQPELNDFVIAMEKLYPTADNLSKSVDNTSKSTINSSAVIGKATKAYEDATAKLQDYYVILDELNSKEGLSAKSKDAIITKYHALLPYLSDEQELRRQLIKIIAQEEETQRNAYADMLIASKEFYNAKVKGNVELSKKLNEYYGIDLENYKSLAEAKESVETALIQTLSAKWQKYFNVTGLGIKETMDNLARAALHGDSYAAKMADELYPAYKKIMETEQAFRDLALDLGGIDFKGINMGNVKTPRTPKTRTSKERYENKELQNALRMLEHRKRISEETQSTIQAEINELHRINKLYVKTEEERMDMVERIYAAEKRLRDRRLQDSINWINEKKNLDQLSVEEEIAAWERVRENQANNIEARKQAELNLYRLRNQVMADSYNKEENHIKHITKLGILSTEQQIEQYRKLYEIKAQSLAEEQSRVENLFDLYKKLISDQQRTIKVAYDERIKQIDEEARRKKAMHEDEIKAIEKELELLNKQEQEYDHNKRMADLREQLAYWQVRTSEDARKKVAELLKQIDEEEHKREVELKRQSLEDKRKILQDEVKSIDETARLEREKWDKSYKEIEISFDDHSINMIALASTMSKGMFEEFQKNYLIPLENALRDGDYGSIDRIVGGIDDFAKDAFDRTYNTTNAQVYRLANQILDYKREYEYGGDKSAAQRAIPLYDELTKLSPSIADMLHRSNYMTAKEFVERLPKAHTGAEVLTYGAAYLKPGELIFPPDLSMKLEDLIQVLYARPIQQSSQSLTDNRKEVKIEKLLNIERNYMEDEIDGEILARELGRAINSIV